MGPEALPGAAVLDERPSPRLLDAPAEAVRKRLAAVEPDRPEDRGPALRLEHRSRAQALLPGDEVEDREVERAVRGRVELRRDPLLVLQLAPHEPVPGRAMRNDVLLADDARRLHAERHEHAVPQHVAVEASRGAADEDAQHQVARVAVVPPRARRELELEAEGQLRQLILGVVAPQVDRALGVVGDARRVRQQVAHGDGPERLRGLRKVLRDRVLQADLALLDERHHRGRRELLAEGAGLEDRVGPHGHAVLDVGEAVALGLDHRAVIHDRHRHARDLLPRHLRAHELVPPGERVRVRGGGDEHEQDRRRALDQERGSHECDSTTAGGPRLWLLAG